MAIGIAAGGVAVSVAVTVATCWVPAVTTVAVVRQGRAARAEAPRDRAHLRIRGAVVMAGVRIGWR